LIKRPKTFEINLQWFICKCPIELKWHHTEFTKSSSVRIQLFQLRLSPEQSGKVEYERERLLGIANKWMNLLAIPSSLPLCSGDNLNWNSCIPYTVYSQFKKRFISFANLKLWTLNSKRAKLNGSTSFNLGSWILQLFVNELFYI
jgi:hypothetical protein